MKKRVTKEDIMNWDDFIDNMNRAAPVDYDETAQDRIKRIKHLETHHEEWFMYYFTKYCTSEPAAFHKRSTKKVLNNPEWVEARPWSRELSKSGRTMMEVLFLTLTGKKRNVMLSSNSYDNACRLLAPYKSILEKNERIINDYGSQEKVGSWTDGEFVTRKGVAFRAIGAGQSPRGSRNEEIRPDVLLVDDFDTDEDCRNPETVDTKIKWVEKAFYATRSISTPLLMIACGNIIAETCCMKHFVEMADHAEVVNIRDKYGVSTWPQKNTEKMIDRVLKPISYASAQSEYFNNPITQGKVFKHLNYKKVLPLKEYQYLVAYTDPSYKSGKKNDYKATSLVGRTKDGEYHVLKMYCDQTTIANMIDWQYEILKYVNGVVPVFFMIEWPWIDDSLQIGLAEANVRHGVTLPLMPDERDKPDKFYRIEALLEPLNRNEKLWFSIALKDSQHMKNTEAQFTALSPTSRAHDDAPDAVEGAVFNINSRAMASLDQIKVTHRSKYNTKRF